MCFCELEQCNNAEPLSQYIRSGEWSASLNRRQCWIIKTWAWCEKVAAMVFSCSCDVKIRDATLEERVDVESRYDDGENERVPMRRQKACVVNK